MSKREKLEVYLVLSWNRKSTSALAILWMRFLLGSKKEIVSLNLSMERKVMGDWWVVTI